VHAGAGTPVQFVACQSPAIVSISPSPPNQQRFLSSIYASHLYPVTVNGRFACYGERKFRLSVIWLRCIGRVSFICKLSNLVLVFEEFLG